MSYPLIRYASQFPEESGKKIRCGNYICLTLKSGLRNTFGMDKTIAPHQKVYSSPNR